LILSIITIAKYSQMKMMSITTNTTENSQSILDLCPELNEAPDNWDELADKLEVSVYELVNEPVSKTTMEVTVTEVTLNRVLNSVNSKSPKYKANRKPGFSKNSKSKSKSKSRSPRSNKTFHSSSLSNSPPRKMMTLSEYHDEKKRECEPIVPSPETNTDGIELSVATLRNRRKKEKIKEKKAAAKQEFKPDQAPTKTSSWESTKKSTKKEVKNPLIRRPDGPGEPMIVKVDNPTNSTLVLKNLPYDCTSTKELAKFFRKCGPVKYIKILTDDNDKCKGIAFVRFESNEGSNKGLNMNGFWYGDRKIYVEYAEDRRL
jgi:hypothetical protein